HEQRNRFPLFVENKHRRHRYGQSSWLVEWIRLAPVKKADLAVRSGWKMDQRRKAAARQMVLLRSSATEPQWRRIKPRKAQQRAAV
ncbi:MAG: hypothetical protein ABW140_14120, partial [Candidatus Sedimenticola sp. 6PFRAG1]